MNTTYRSDLTDAEWKRVRPLFDRFWFRKHHPRDLLNAMLYLVKTGCQWRMLPANFPAWQTVYPHFRKWQRLGLLRELSRRVRRAARVADGRDPSPSAAVIDTQSVDTGRQGGPQRGSDPSKQVCGRKRHVLTDTMGLLLGVFVHAANEHDSQKAPSLLHRVVGTVPRLETIFADGGYEGLPPGLLDRKFGWDLDIVSREDRESEASEADRTEPSKGGFTPLPKRWVIERTFGWLDIYRRLNKDDERHPETAEAMVHLAMIRLMVRRIS